MNNNSNKIFIKISDSFLNYWKFYLKFYYWNGYTEKDIASYYIINTIFTSYLAEIGLKALLAYESGTICHGHCIDELFIKLHPQTQEVIAHDMGYKIHELLKKLKENRNHFSHWRYYYELKCNQVDIKLMESLLNTIYVSIIYLRKKEPLKKDEI